MTEYCDYECKSREGKETTCWRKGRRDWNDQPEWS